MVPIIELRGAIPLGVINGLDVGTALIVSVLGNLVPVPFIIIFIRKIFKWMQSKSERLGRLVRKFEDKADKKKDQVVRYEFWGLMILVAVPLPGTGAWTGALVAAMLDMQLKRAFPSIALGGSGGRSHSNHGYLWSKSDNLIRKRDPLLQDAREGLFRKDQMEISPFVRRYAERRAIAIRKTKVILSAGRGKIFPFCSLLAMTYKIVPGA